VVLIAALLAIFGAIWLYSWLSTRDSFPYMPVARQSEIGDMGLAQWRGVSNDEQVRYIKNMTWMKHCTDSPEATVQRVTALAASGPVAPKTMYLYTLDVMKSEGCL
jgi:hypothetical protein